MANECKIEYYFKAAELAKLLEANPSAKGIIISQEIVRQKPKGGDHYVNVVYIRARIDKPAAAAKTMATESLTADGDPGDGDGINGCPYPPGCTE